MKTITFNLNNSWIENFRIMYDDFLTYEHTTPQKQVWLEQDRIYRQILKASDPKAEYLRITENGGFTVAEVAKALLEKKNG